MTDRGGDTFRSVYWVKRAVYRGDRPGPIARWLNAFWAKQYASGGSLSRDRDVTLEVRGRTSGKTIASPVVMADLDDSWYLVSMLGEHANWVRNVRAAEGRATIRRGEPTSVTLDEVPVAERAPILKRYLDVAPGARPHVPVERRAPEEEFAAIAADFPVFRIDGLGA
ncbi:nitroreductase/quinone reductase family protein [Agromyces rhizosphaerae]|nr:nitroreductase/quinone reductase family protein [Agromyces rhizosphaerae]